MTNTRTHMYTVLYIYVNTFVYRCTVLLYNYRLSSTSLALVLSTKPLKFFSIAPSWAKFQHVDHSLSKGKGCGQGLRFIKNYQLTEISLFLSISPIYIYLSIFIFAIVQNVVASMLSRARTTFALAKIVFSSI